MTEYNWQPMYCEECKERYSNIGVAGGYWKDWNKLCKTCSDADIAIRKVLNVNFK